VTGVTVVDEKYVYVRGLGERYGAAMLNGAALPSPEVDRKVVPLDLIPSSFLENVVTSKTFTPDQRADNAGGVVQLNTRRATGLAMLGLGARLEYNSVSTTADGLLYSGGLRGLPGTLPSDRPVQEAAGLSPTDLESIGESFGRPWGPGASRLPVNQHYSAALGSELSLFGQSLGFFGSFNYGNEYANDAEIVERVLSASGAADPEVDYRGQATNHSVRLGGLLTASYSLGATNKLSLTGIYNRLTDDEGRILQGYNLDSNTNQRNTRIRHLEQTILSSQLAGNHLLNWLFGSTVAWRAAYSRAGRLEPNTREVLYRQDTGGLYLFDTFVQSGSIFYQDLLDDGVSGGADVTVPFRISGRGASLKVGASADSRDRSVYTRRFRFLPQGAIGDSVRALAPDPLFGVENIAPDSFQVQEATFRPDNYDGQQSIYAGYVMLDAELLPRLRVVAGGRVESAEMTVQPRDLFPTGLPPLAPARLDDTDLLPSLNLTYGLSQSINLRAAFSRTLARPEFRELAPFSFADFAGGFLVTGNPTLQRSLVTNYDLRWEWFPRQGAVLAVSGFLKDFQNPIEVLVFPSSELIKSWINAPSAHNYGVELELRSDLGIIAPALQNFYLNTNLTLVWSEVQAGGEASIYVPGSGPATLGVVERARPLQGQSPYVINAGLTYSLPGIGTTTTLLYNRFGRRIDSVGGQFLDDIYEEARDQLDLVIKQPVGPQFELSFAANRILGHQYLFTQGGDVVRSYDSGRSFQMALNWAPKGF
jgi:outer membrane receptor protein involved in Fe transport